MIPPQLFRFSLALTVREIIWALVLGGAVGLATAWVVL